MRLLPIAIFVLSCGGSEVPGTATADDEDDDGSTCVERTEAEHPSYSSDRLRLELREEPVTSGMVIPPFEIEVVVDEDISSPIEMELTLYDPAGRTHVQRFRYENMREQCDPICDPVVGGPPCPERRCWMVRYRPDAIRIDRDAYRGSVPGVWTFVLHRLDDGDRVSVQKRLFEGEKLEGEECEALPVALGAYRRVSCRRGVVPTGSFTHHWGLAARYERGHCRANAFALPLDHAARTLFHEGPYGSAETRSFPEGEVHEVDLDEVTARAWLAHHHAYIVAAREGTPGYDGLVRALLEVFPDVGGPVREVPSCNATGAVIERRVAPTPIDRLEADARFLTHFEGNRPSGALASFHDQHPLALAGLRRNEIVQTVDGERVRDRRAVRAVLERMTHTGSMDIVVSRERVRHARCIRLTIAEGGARPDAGPPPTQDAGVPPPPPPPPPPPDRGGRHCERRTSECWDCVDIQFPAEIGCTGCRGRDLCITQGGTNQCLAPTRVCCMPGTPCNTPPGCDGPASSCATERAGGRNERCTFLGTCPTPLPRR